MSKNVYLAILKYGSLLSFVSLFLVSKYLLFPYVSTKQIFFNILIEILFVVWIVFVYKFPQYRPKKSWITWGFLAYLGAILLSSIFGVDFNLSFWGDIERMLGFFQLAHFFVFYLIIITALRKKRDWDLVKLMVVISGVAISLLSVFGEPISTLGNEAYVAGYLIFSIYFALILFFREKHQTKWLYIVSIVLMIPGFIRAGISGAYVGLGFSILMFFLIFGVLSSKKIRKITLSLFLLFSVLTVLAFSFKSAPVLRNIKPLQEISIQKVTFQTRLISWKAGIKDFPNHPILGTGYGNFAITFDKHFSADFYSYTKTGTYFDRAHNNIIDIASTSGLAGILSYLSILIAFVVYLIKVCRKKKISKLEFSLLLSLLIAYFVQNLAIFDSLPTYLGLLVLLGYVHYLATDKEDGGEKKKIRSGDLILLIVGLLIILYPIIKLNVEPVKMMKTSIMGHMGLSGGHIEEGMEYYYHAYDYDTPWDRDSRNNFVNLVTRNYQILSQVTLEMLDFAVQQAEANIPFNEQDTIHQLQLARVLNTSARFHNADPEKSDSYAYRALTAIDRAIESSPQRVELFFLKSQIHLTLEDSDSAIEVLRYAQELNPDYYESYCHLGKVLYSVNQQDMEAKILLDMCIDANLHNLLEPSVVKSIINMYIGYEDIERVTKLYEQLVTYESNVVQHWVNLSKLHAQAGNIEKAVKAAQEVVRIDPNLKDGVDSFIAGLK